jgi:hypothetical protein
MPAPSVRILAENLPEQRFLEAIFQEEMVRNLVEISSWLTSSAVIGIAQRTLLEQPGRPVALVLNSNDSDPQEIEDRSRTVRRILSQITPDNWHVTLAIPKVDSWIRADPRIAQAFQADETMRNDRYNQAVQIGYLVQQAPLDRLAIGRVHPEFAALAEFIQRHLPVPQTAS